MARVVMVFNNPIVRLADDELGLATGDAYECQITSAVVSTNVPFNTIPATGCAGASQSPGTPGYQADLAWLQDWSAPGGGLSGWAWAHKAAPAWIEITPAASDPTTKLTGQVYVTPGQFGGTFGDGSAGPATATWPFVDEPDITMPAPVVLEAEAEAEDLERV